LAKSTRIGRIGLTNPEADAPIPDLVGLAADGSVRAVAWRAQPLYRRGIFRWTKSLSGGTIFSEAIMLRDDINNAVKDAMKAKEERKLSTLRMVNSTIKNVDIAARGEGKPPLSDADLLGVFQKMIKQRQESVELYEKGGRAELAAQEREEIAIIQAYLPKQMSDDEMKAAISAAIAETGAAGMKDMGKVIGVLRAKFAGQMDFGKASGLVKAALAG
jgi:uncharacterized protein YqeY